MGGKGTNGERMLKDGEVFDLAKREWEPLGTEMCKNRGSLSGIAGVMIVLSDGNSLEKYDEHSRRWLKLRATSVVSRPGTGLVSVPALALRSDDSDTW